MSKIYVVKDPLTDAVVCEGTADECAAALGFKTGKNFRNAVTKFNMGNYKRYEIVTEEFIEKQKAIRAWDEFTEPLRKKFGIPRYKGN